MTQDGSTSLPSNTAPIAGPAVAVDVLLFAIREETLQTLLIKISVPPYDGKWALPGGLVRLTETLDQAVERVLKEKAGIKDVYLEQLYSFGDLDRDSRSRSISVAYFALIDSDKFELKTSELYSDIGWHSIGKLPELAFDHKKIIEYGVERLRAKLEYTNIAYGLLPKEFTLSRLQQIYEIILGKTLDKRNFRKRIKQLDILEPTDKFSTGTAKRPAGLYRFKKRDLVFTK
jgi:8-oxo-dGTP diphosphatase